MKAAVLGSDGATAGLVTCDKVRCRLPLPTPVVLDPAGLPFGASTATNRVSSSGLPMDAFPWKILWGEKFLYLKRGALLWDVAVAWSEQ